MWLWHRGDILLLLLHLWASTGSGKAFVEKRVMQNLFFPSLPFLSPLCNSLSFFGLKQERIKPPGVLGGQRSS